MAQSRSPFLGWTSNRRKKQQSQITDAMMASWPLQPNWQLRYLTAEHKTTRQASFNQHTETQPGEVCEEENHISEPSSSSSPLKKHQEQDKLQTDIPRISETDKQGRFQNAVEKLRERKWSYQPSEGRISATRDGGEQLVDMSNFQIGDQSP